MDILNETKTSTGYFTDLLRISSKSKYVDTVQYSVDSEDPGLFQQAIFNYFSHHEGIYNKLRDKMQADKKNLQRLAKFESDVKAGRDKSGCLTDFQNLNEKSKKLNKVTNELYEKTFETQVKKEKPGIDEQNPEDLIDNINRRFIDNTKKCKQILGEVEDLKSDLAKLSDIENKYKILLKKTRDDNQLQDILGKTLLNNEKVGELRSELDPSVVEQKFQVSKSEDPKAVMMSISEVLKNTFKKMGDCKTKIEELTSELDYLKKQQNKKGDQKGASIQDLQYLFDLNNKLEDNIRDTSLVLTDKPEPEIKFKKASEEDDEAEVIVENSAKLIKNSNRIINNLTEELQLQKKEIEKLRIFELEVRQGKNKDYAKHDYRNIYDSSKR